MLWRAALPRGALVNAIKHGNRMEPDKKVYIACELTEDELTIVIEDQGNGFKLEEVPDPTEDDNLEKPGGRGIMLIRSFMNGFSYNDKGNRLTIRKKWALRTKSSPNWPDARRAHNNRVARVGLEPTTPGL